jgi:hypothetical protein
LGKSSFSFPAGNGTHQLMREENHRRAVRDLVQAFISEASALTERTSAIELASFRRGLIVAIKILPCCFMQTHSW